MINYKHLIQLLCVKNLAFLATKWLPYSTYSDGYHYWRFFALSNNTVGNIISMLLYA